MSTVNTSRVGSFKVLNADDTLVSSHNEEKEAIAKLVQEHLDGNTGAYVQPPGRYNATVDISDILTVEYDRGFQDGVDSIPVPPPPPEPQPSTDITVSLNGGDQTLNVDDAYIELGAEATGPMGDGVSIQISGAVDTTTAGTYPVTYTATDTQGNVASASRTVTVTGTSSPPPPPSGSLLAISDFVYQGGFTFDNGDFGADNMNSAAGPIAYNPANHSLFTVGHDDRTVAEWAIPTLLDTAPASMNRVAAPIQNFQNVFSGITNPQGIDIITGMLCVNGKLIVNAEEKYNGGGGNTDTTIICQSADNLSGGTRNGWYRLSGAAEVAGYLAEVPPEWQTALGNDYMTGWSNVYSINSRYSIGPSLASFDADALLAGAYGASGSVPTTEFMNFDYSGGSSQWIDPAALDQGQGAGAVSDLWNHETTGVYGFIVPNTNTFAVFGGIGGVDSGIGYKITQDTGNVCSGYCPYVASDYSCYYWFFDIQEIIDATNVYDPRPYAYGEFPVPHSGPGKLIIGGTYDAASKMLYLTIERAGGTTSQYDSSPMIVGYQVN